MVNDIDYNKTAEKLERYGNIVVADTFRFAIPDAKNVLMRGLQYFVGTDARWINSYNEVAEWLSDNHGKGLLLMGDCGLGKSVICTQIIPTLLNHYCNKIVNVFYQNEINRSHKAIEESYISVVDDIGSEPELSDYGSKRMVLKELVDNAERNGHMLIMTTNLLGNELRDVYDIRTVDRLRHITKCIVFEGCSMRK